MWLADGLKAPCARSEIPQQRLFLNLLGDAGLQLRRALSAITLERAVETQGLRCECGPEVFFLLRR
jgi:hypothetical protein